MVKPFKIPSILTSMNRPMLLVLHIFIVTNDSIITINIIIIAAIYQLQLKSTHVRLLV